MRRRFGRGRKRPEGGSFEPIDASHWLGRLSESGVVGAEALEPVELEGLPGHFAVLGRAAGEGARDRMVGFSPERGSDAVLAVLAWAARAKREGGPEAELLAVAPDWVAADRRRLALLVPALPLDCVSASALAEGGRLRPEAPEALRFEPEHLTAQLSRADETQLCRRALAGLEGLAAKHGGALRGVDERVELMVLAQRCAALVADRGLRIEVYEPERATLNLSGPDALATALDRLEGLLRKLLNDRRNRGGEGGLRAALAPLLERAADVSLREVWPLGGPDGEPVDWVGLSPEGRCSVGAARERLDLPALARILDGAARAPAVAASLAQRAGRVPRSETPALHLAATEFDSAALDALSALGLSVQLYTASPRRSGEWGLEARELTVLEGDTRGSRRSAEPRERGPRRPRSERPPSDSARGAATGAAAASLASRPEAEGADGEASGDSETAGPRFEEVSLFDLDDENGGGGEEGSRRRRRRRRGRRGRGAAEGDSGRSEATGDDAEPRGDRPEPRRRPQRAAASDDDDSDDLDLPDDDTLAPLAEDAPDLDEPDAAFEPEEEDDGDDGEEDRDSERARRERELRRRARSPKAAEPPPPPRRRAAFVAHADRISVLTAVVLARDVRLVEGFWVYPQGDLMTFFRSVATDLNEQTPVFLVGFAASPPARDTLQSASLYRGRLDWFDHHDWPPEDLESLRATLGEDHVHVQPGAESSLAAVIAQRSRRSRFSDKLMELATGRFTQHDYERWGRWWWHRLGEIAEQHGDRKNDVAPLLAGRPSDLAKDVARAEEPPLPPELAYVSERDFRLVHCGGGLSMVVVEVPENLDLHLCARIARERYDAELSLATAPGRDLVVWSADDSRTKRSLDLGGLAAHLANKHAWVEALSDDDHVARVRVQGLHSRADRLDDLIREIAMGRSIVEG